MKIKELSIKNFKGIKDYTLTINDEDIITNIKGKNGSGKTSIKKAYFWCLGAEVGDVIPCKDNKEIPNLEIEVELKMKIDDVEYSFRRLQKERYKTDKETMQKVKAGNDCTYYIDNIETKQAEYKEKLANIIGVEKYNKLLMLSELEYFNSTMKWQERREELFSHIEYNNEELLKDEKFSLIKLDIEKGNSIVNLKKAYNDSIKAIKENKLKVASYIEILEKEIENFDESKGKELNEKLAKLKKEQDQIYANAKKYNELLDEYKNVVNSIDRDKAIIETYKNREKELTNSYNNQMSNYDNIIATSQSEIKKCPYCESIIDEEKSNKIIAKVELQKKELKDTYTKNIKANKENIEKATNNLNEKNNLLEMFNASYKLEEIQEKAKDVSKVQVINNELYNVNLELTTFNKTKESISAIDNYRKNLMDLTQKELVELGKLSALNEYSLAISKKINEKVNNLFANVKGVEFALFDFANYKGDITDICLAMFNGKSYDECSTGEKYLLNFNIVNTLQDLYNVDLPILCDNYECLSTKLKTNRQLITFEVSNNEIENLNKI